MSPRKKLHEDEIDVHSGLVRRLVAEQFPEWAQLPLEPVVSPGTSNVLYRLGAHMVVRLPLVEWALEQVEKEHRWLPRLAPHLPLAIPEPIAMGRPSEEYPWPWSIYRWIEGESAVASSPADPREAATALVEFVAALHRVDAADGLSPGAHNFFRGVPLATRDAPVREALVAVGDTVDVAAAAAAWEASLGTPTWEGPPVLIHGDLIPSNLLIHAGKLSAVIDFGGLGVGDPACDLLACWSFLSSETRGLFRDLLGVDDATWSRGRGWALSVGLIALPYYRETSPVFAALASHMIEEVLSE